jgi:hypothetical protein
MLKQLVKQSVRSAIAIVAFGMAVASALAQSAGRSR